MSQSVLSIRLDEDLKRDADNVCKRLGLSTASAVKVFLTKVVNERRIPFEIEEDPFYSEENMKALKESIQQIKDGLAEKHELIEV